MVKLKKSILDKIVNPHSNTKYDMLLATVKYYDGKSNRAHIEFEDPNIKGKMYLENVPVQLGSGGVHSSGPFIGQDVWVAFQNSSPLHPKIVSLADEDYKNNTRESFRHIRKGSLIPNLKNAKTIEIPPKNVEWTTENSSTAYIAFKDMNAENDLLEKSEGIFYYTKEEPGITHPLNSSTIRIKNNGNIDIFVGTNEGIRINPEDKTITVLGTSLNINSSSWTINTNSINIEAKEDINLKCKTLKLDCIIERKGE